MNFDSEASNNRDLVKVAYHRIREAIRNGKLQAGERVTEMDLTRSLGMSRTPVREAIYRLESEGLFTHEPRRGLTVTRPDHQMVMELYTMREALIGTACRLAAQHATDAEIEALNELIEEASGLFDDPDALADVNRKIHQLIYLSAHNRYLIKSLEVVESAIALLPKVTGGAERAAEWHRQHKRIVEAIASRDFAAAEETARAHLRSSRKYRLDLLLNVTE